MPGSQRCRRSPTDDESSEDVDDEGDIHEAAPRGNVGQVRNPELVRACGVEVALHEVHRASAARIRLRRLESTSTDRPLEAHFTHQTGHRASSHVAALTAQLTPTLRTPYTSKFSCRTRRISPRSWTSRSLSLAGGLGPSLALSARNRSTGRSEASGRSARPRNSHGVASTTTHSPRSAVELRLGEKRRRLAKDLVRPL